MTPQDRFWAYVDKGPGCWEWTGHKNQWGYGRINVGGRLISVHRLSYEWAIGPIPEGLTIDHICRMRACVRPDHLEAVTLAENLRRGARAITRCPKGHPYEGANLYRNPRTGHRSCRTCHRVREMQRHRRARAEQYEEALA